MGRKSTIALLDPKIKAECDRLIREGKATIDEIVAHLRGLGADVPRSTLGDYKKRMEAQLRRYREAQEVAGAWVGQLGAQPDSQLGQLLAELLKTVAFQTLAHMNDGEAGAQPMDIMLVAKALNDLARAQKTDHEYREKLRAAWQAELQARASQAEAEVKKVAESAGLSEEAAARIREIVLGVVG